MASETSLIEALNKVLECLKKSDTSSETIDAIKAENEKLRQEKFELMTNLNQLLETKTTQVVVIKSLTSQVEIQNQVQAKFKEITTTRIKKRSERTSEQTELYKETVKLTESSIILPYNKVQQKINDMKIKTEDNLQKRRNLTEEYKKQIQHLADLKKFSETLKNIEKEQKRRLKQVRKTQK